MAKNLVDRRRQSRQRDLEVGGRIRMHRRNAKMTLQGLADRLGIAYQQVQKYETGVNRIGAGRLIEIAEILDVPVSSFFAPLDKGVEEVMSSPEIALATELSAELAAQGRELLVDFLRLSCPEKRRLALDYLRTLSHSTVP